MVDATADANRILLQRPQPRQRLAGVADLRGCAVDGIDPRRGRGRDPTEVTDEVEHGALGSQKSAGIGLQSQQRLASPQPGAVIHPIQDAIAAGAEDFVEHQQSDVDAGGDPRFPRDQCRCGAEVFGHSGDRGDVGSVAEIFVEAAADRDESLGTLVGGGSHGRAGTTGTRCSVRLSAWAGSESGKSRRW